MLDLQAIRENPATLDAALAKRGVPAMAGQLLELDERRRAVQTEQQSLQARRNTLSREVGEIKKSGGDASALMEEVKKLGPQLEQLKEEEADLAQRLEAQLTTLPNSPSDDVPVADSEEGNAEVRRWGTPKTFDFAVREHDDIAAGLGMLDMPTAAKIAGARFAWLSGPLAKLERALAAFFLDTLTNEFGFTETRVPYLVNAEAMFGTGQLPKFEEDLFKTTDGRYLIPTSEVPLTNLGNERIFAAAELPVKLTAWTPCFRSEAGSAGRDTKGLIRMHQFDKVEMVQLVAPEESEAAHQLMVQAAETMLQKLELPYRVMLLCTGDMGFGARKTYDLEVWVPSQDKYREISSCSNCGDFQARRMKARFKRTQDSGTEYINTLNGSGLAVGRTLVALLENHQQADGSVAIPSLLQPYMGGLQRITKAS